MWTVAEEQCAVGAGELRTLYAELRSRGTHELDAGRLEEALTCFEEALGVAERIGDRELVAMAFCNRVAVLITLGRYEEELQRLREILMESRGLELAFSAAYNLARAYELKKAYKKSLFYAQISRDKALAMAREDLVAKSGNQIGRCLVAESHFAKAIAVLEGVLDALPEENSVIRVTVLFNMAYPKIVLGELEEGFRLLFACLRWYRRMGLGLYEAWPHLCLCYAYSEIGRIRRAWMHGRRGLELAEQSGNHEAIKVALFLLGDIEKSAGEVEAATRYFTRLRDDYYPDNENLPQAMLFLETKKLVNLRA